MLVGRSASAFRSRTIGGISGIRANGENHSYYGTLENLHATFLSMFESLASVTPYIIMFAYIFRLEIRFCYVSYVFFRGSKVKMDISNIDTSLSNDCGSRQYFSLDHFCYIFLLEKKQREHKYLFIIIICEKWHLFGHDTTNCWTLSLS